MIDSNQPPLLRIYSACSTLMGLKRRLFGRLALNSLPSSSLTEQKRMSSTRIFLCLKKLMSEFKNQMGQIQQVRHHSQHLLSISLIAGKLKNNTQLLTQQEKLIAQANCLIDSFKTEKDPLSFYEQAEREELHGRLSAKLKEIRASAASNTETKKPLYVRKLERELRDNLQLLAEQERKFNISQENIVSQSRKKIIKTIVKLFDALSKTPRNSLVQQQMQTLLRTHIQVFNQKESSIRQKNLISYRKDLRKTLKHIVSIFEEEKKCYQLLVVYICQIQSAIKGWQKSVRHTQDQISKEAVNICQQINSIVQFEESLQLNNQCQDLWSFLHSWPQFLAKITKMSISIDQALFQATQLSRKANQRITNSQPVSSSSSLSSKPEHLEQLITDKKNIQILIRKQKSFETALFQAFNSLLQRFYRSLNQVHHHKDIAAEQEINKLKLQKVFQKLFTNYFQETEAFQKASQSKNSHSVSNSNITLRSNNEVRIKEIQAFTNSLSIFDQNIDWTDCYQCSLGPRLLIHGKMKIFPNGIYYESKFNKKNVFFGKTRLFLPRQQIFQVNKEAALGIFPDVIEIVTSKGGVYFHALGKRQIMSRTLTDTFFPQINSNEDQQNQLPFNDFDGSQSMAQNRIKQYLQKLEYQIVSGIVPDCDFRVFFHKYFSDQEFTYQGKIHNDFKHFMIELAGGSNIKGTSFTPGIPNYLHTNSTDINEDHDDLFQSERCFTYGKSIPMIPLVSKGGEGLCQQKSIFRWGGPHSFVIDIFTTLSGFSLTDGMVVHSRQTFKEKNGGVYYEVTAQANFETSSAMNTILKTAAFSTLRGLMEEVFELIKKQQKVKKMRSIGSLKKIYLKEQQQEESQRITKLKEQNSKLKNQMKMFGTAMLLIYIMTLCFLKF